MIEQGKSIVKNVWYFLKCEIPQFMSNWRLIPRVFMLLYGYAFYMTMQWFMALPEPNNAQAGFVSVVVGAGAAWFGLYAGTGPKMQKEDKK